MPPKDSKTGSKGQKTQSKTQKPKAPASKQPVKVSADKKKQVAAKKPTNTGKKATGAQVTAGETPLNNNYWNNYWNNYNTCKMIDLWGGQIKRKNNKYQTAPPASKLLVGGVFVQIIPVFFGIKKET